MDFSARRASLARRAAIPSRGWGRRGAIRASAWRFRPTSAGKARASRSPRSSRRWRSAPRIVGKSGRPRSARSSRRRARSSRARLDCSSRASVCARAASRSARAGMAISAAAVGVGARRSEAKSIRVVSVSCPTALISGIGLSAAARTTISSLKAIRSSRLPPPRATMMTSGRIPAGRVAKPRMAAAICSAAPAPCTGTGQSRMRRGKRRAMVVRMSWMTAPRSLETTPMVTGSSGRARFRSGANRPSSSRRFRSASIRASRAPSPAYSSRSITSWYLERSA